MEFRKIVYGLCVLMMTLLIIAPALAECGRQCRKASTGGNKKDWKCIQDSGSGSYIKRKYKARWYRYCHTKGYSWNKCTSQPPVTIGYDNYTCLNQLCTLGCEYHSSGSQSFTHCTGGRC